MAEWFKAAVLKTVVRSHVPRVRIPLSPQIETSSGVRDLEDKPDRPAGVAAAKLTLFCLIKL